jgi:hypothetical protein
MHMAFHLLYVYEYVINYAGKQAAVILNHNNENVRYIGEGKARHRKCKRLKLGSGQAYDRSSD